MCASKTKPNEGNESKERGRGERNITCHKSIVHNYYFCIRLFTHHSLTHSLTRSLTRSLAHSHTHSLTPPIFFHSALMMCRWITSCQMHAPPASSPADRHVRSTGHRESARRICMKVSVVHGLFVVVNIRARGRRRHRTWFRPSDVTSSPSRPMTTSIGIPCTPYLPAPRGQGKDQAHAHARKLNVGEIYAKTDKT